MSCNDFRLDRRPWLTATVRTARRVLCAVLGPACRWILRDELTAEAHKRRLAALELTRLAVGPKKDACRARRRELHAQGIEGRKQREDEVLQDLIEAKIAATFAADSMVARIDGRDLWPERRDGRDA